MNPWDTLPPLRVYGEHSVFPTPDVRGPKPGEVYYVRVDLPDLGTVDAKATRWTDERVCIRWADAQDTPSTAWVPADWVARIGREESGWRDVYDKL
jgi:hypothetical protein